MAFPVTLNGRTYTLADFEGTNYVDGFPDALEDFVTQAGDIYNDTSSTSETIGTGSKTFTVSEGKPYQEGTPLRIADASSPDTNFLDCVVTSYSGTSLTVNAFGFAGSGTYSSWTINIGGAKTVDGTLAVSQGGTGATSASAARTNLDVYSKSEANSRFLDVSGEASDVTMNGNVSIGDSSADTLQVNATATLEDATLVTADINGGTIDGTVIGGNSAAAGTFTTITGSSDMNIDSGTLFVDSANNRVGVGTSSPDHHLHVEAATGGGISFGDRAKAGTFSIGLTGGGNFSGNNNAINFVMNGDATGSTHYRTNAGSHVFIDSSSEAARIDSSGNLLVGTTSGSDKLTVAGDAEINGLTVGRGGGDDDQNVAIGISALQDNTTGRLNTALGTESLLKNTSGERNTGVGFRALKENIDASYNAALGMYALRENVSGGTNTAVGYHAMLNNTTGNANVAVGYEALQDATTGIGNTIIGRNAGRDITTGSRNTILGSYNGNQNGLDIRTSNNNIVLSDGDGNPRQIIDGSGNVGIGNTNPNAKLEVGNTLFAVNSSGAVLNSNGRYAQLTKGNENTGSGASVDFVLSVNSIATIYRHGYITIIASADNRGTSNSDVAWFLYGASTVTASNTFDNFFGPVDSGGSTGTFTIFFDDTTGVLNVSTSVDNMTATVEVGHITGGVNIT